MPLKSILIKPDTTILKAIEIIDAGSMQIALIVNDDGKLLGTLTDGDVRRGLLKGIPLNEPVAKIMNEHPKSIRLNQSREQTLELMKSNYLKQMPVLDDEGRVVRLELLDELIQTPFQDNPVVLMAGGLGQRLRPLTNDLPKPMLKVGDKPILENIIEAFVEHGFKSFYVSTNYKAEIIEDYFGRGERWGADISYVRDEKRMGTAGSLSLLPKPLKPFFVMNADLLTTVNFRQLLNYHIEQEVRATMCVSVYDYQVPYGVVNIKKNRIDSIDEKPVHKFFVNAGIYVLDPSVLECIPKDTFFDMPSLFEELIRRGNETAAFPIREYWLDIGRHDDLEKANGEFSKIFR